MGAVVQLVEYRTRNREVASSTHTRSTASNLEQANLRALILHRRRRFINHLLTYLLTVCSGQLSLLPSAGREMSSSYGYGVKA